MWLFTPSGFLSIAAALEAFCARTGAAAPLETPGRDYRFRTSVPFPLLAADLAAEAEAIDYPNFKDAVAARRGRDRAHRYARIWSVMHDLQQDEAHPPVRDRPRRATR